MNLAKEVADVNFLPDAMLAVGDRHVRCKVLQLREGKPGSAIFDVAPEKTVWIDEDEEKILKIVERKLVSAPSRGGSRDVEMGTTFSTTFDADPPDCLFSVEASDLSKLMNPKGLVGKKLPELRFRSPDGTAMTLRPIAGKPLLIDFWATWCTPCVAALPELAEIYQEAKGKGLIVLAVDQDHDPDKGSSFLQKKGYQWPDFHDPEGEVHKQLSNEGLPHVILVDSTGTIVHEGSGEDAKELRSRIAKLGPQFSSLAPESGPCTIPR